jgi:putative membrane protein
MTSYTSFGWILQVLIFVLFFLIVWWLMKSGRFTQQQQETAEEILKKRLAKGEITKKEYDSLKKEIE